MKTFSLKCPYCNASLTAEDGLDTFYCKYCGGKILVEGMSKNAYKAKVRIKELDHEKLLKDKDIDQERYKMAFVSQEKQKDWVRKVVENIGSVLLFILIFFLFGLYFGSEIKKHNDKITKLQQLEVEIETAMNDGDYSKALFKANQIYCDDDYSSEETKAWDEKRKSYIALIEERKRVADLNNPDNIFMPASSDSLTGKKYNDVIDQLSGIGFTNISTKEASEKAGFLKKEGTIEHILIGGKTDFSTKDYFNKDTQIIVYYYTK